MNIRKYFTATALVMLLAACDDGKNVNSELQMIGSDEISGVTLEDMNTAIHPGDDFFQYVNGTWLDNTEIPADKSRYGAFNVLRDNAEDDVRLIIEEAAASGAVKGSSEQQVGDLYKSYMDMETRNARGIEPLKKHFANIDAITDLNDLSIYFAQAGKLAYSTPIALFIDVDAKVPTEYALQTWQSGLGLPDREYYFNDDEKSVEIRTKYVEHINKMFELADIKTDTGKIILDFETKIAQIHWLKEDNRDDNKRYNKYTVGDFKSMMSNLNVDQFMEITGANDVTSLIVNQPSFMEGLNGLMASENIDVWKTYLKWSIVNDMASRLNSAMDNQNFEFYSKTLSGVEEQRPLWRRAVSSVSSNLGEVVGEVYVSKHFKPDAKARMVELVGNLIKAYETSIREINWMGQQSKEKALAKLSKFTPKIGYPDKWKDYSTLVIEADDYAGNIERSALTVHNRELAKLGGPIDKTEWFMTPQTVNAYYNPTMNEIVFPAAILQPPFFNMPADDAVNYGAIGGVIGHEIGHGFDDSGSRYNGDGALENWWTEEDRTKFNELTSALVVQYNAYEPIEGVNVNGTFTLGENIGDLSGLSIAYKAYKMSLNGEEAPVIDGLTGDQRFFIGWAQAFKSKIRDEALETQIRTDPHSPDQYRVNGIVYNIDAFYSAFGINEAHALYIRPEDRVKIW